MANFFRAPAPGKVNLSLRVLRRRDDGFHELQTRMSPISLQDEIELERRPSGGVELRCDDPGLPLGEENLALKAVRAYEAASGQGVHARITIRKNLPSGAGMGGGSSDAATVLQLLNQAYGTGLPVGALAEMAAKIGSDVAFFLYGQTCDASGRGELIEPVEFTERLSLLLIKPPFGVSTPWAYSRWHESVENPSFPYASQTLWFGDMVNDLERPVFEKYPLLGDLKRWLLVQEEVAGAMMSGSGATVFAVINGGSRGADLAERVCDEFGKTFWTRLVSVTA